MSLQGRFSFKQHRQTLYIHFPSAMFSRQSSAPPLFAAVCGVMSLLGLLGKMTYLVIASRRTALSLFQHVGICPALHPRITLQYLMNFMGILQPFTMGKALGYNSSVSMLGCTSIFSLVGEKNDRFHNKVREDLGDQQWVDVTNMCVLRLTVPLSVGEFPVFFYIFILSMLYGGYNVWVTK